MESSRCLRVSQAAYLRHTFRKLARTSSDHRHYSAAISHFFDIKMPRPSSDPAVNLVPWRAISPTSVVPMKQTRHSNTPVLRTCSKRMRDVFRIRLDRTMVGQDRRIATTKSYVPKHLRLHIPHWQMTGPNSFDKSTPNWQPKLAWNILHVYPQPNFLWPSFFKCLQLVPSPCSASWDTSEEGPMVQKSRTPLADCRMRISIPPTNSKADPIL